MALFFFRAGRSCFLLIIQKTIWHEKQSNFPVSPQYHEIVSLYLVGPNCDHHNHSMFLFVQELETGSARVKQVAANQLKTTDRPPLFVGPSCCN